MLTYFCFCWNYITGLWCITLYHPSFRGKIEQGRIQDEHLLLQLDHPPHNMTCIHNPASQYMRNLRSLHISSPYWSTNAILFVLSSTNISASLLSAFAYFSEMLTTDLILAGAHIERMPVRETRSGIEVRKGREHKMNSLLIQAI